MGLKEFLLRGKLSRTEREARRLHGHQKRVRGQLDDLEGERKKGMAEGAYKDRKAKLEQKRHEIIAKLKTVEEQERQLRAEVHAADRASA